MFVLPSNQLIFVTSYLVKRVRSKTPTTLNIFQKTQSLLTNENNILTDLLFISDGFYFKFLQKSENNLYTILCSDRQKQKY